MAYALELYFDEDAENAVKNIWQALIDNRLSSPGLHPGYRPHITLAVFHQVNSDGMRMELKRFANQIGSLDTWLTQLEIVRNEKSEVVVRASLTPELENIHRQLWTFIKKYIQSPRPGYAVGQWVPTCPLAEDLLPIEVDRAMAICEESALPIPCHVNAIGLVQRNPNRCNPVFVASLEGGVFRDRS